MQRQDVTERTCPRSGLSPTSRRQRSSNARQHVSGRATGICGRWCAFFLSSRRRHTRCGRDWSSTCALPIFYSLVVLEELGQAGGEDGLEAALDQLGGEIRDNLVPHGYYTELRLGDDKLTFDPVNDYTVLERRSEERRVGKECRSRWAANHER